MKEEMNYGSLSGELHHLMRRVSHKLHFSLDNHRNKNRILHIVKERGGVTQSELTEKIGITPSSMSTALTKLEREGLIQRRSDENDKRTHRIYVTEKGAARWAEEQSEMNRASEKLFGCLSEEEQRELCRLLKKLDADWEKSATGAEEIDARGHRGGRRRGGKAAMGAGDGEEI